MPLKEALELPPATRPAGFGLLPAARDIPGQFWRGVVVNSGQCLPVQPWPYCPPDGLVKTSSRPTSGTEFEAFGVVQAVECTTLSSSEIEERAETSLSVTREYQIGEALAVGVVGTVNPALTGQEVVGTAAGTVEEALAQAEDEASDRVTARLSVHHVAPSDATRLLASQAIFRDGRLWRTAAGNVVVASPGYTALQGAVYTTGEVFAGFGEGQTLTDVERSLNTETAYAEEAAVVAFEPCTAFQVEV